MRADDERELIKAALTLQCALVGNGSLTPEDFKSTQERAQHLYLDLANALRPWAAKTPEQAKQEVVDELIELYKKHIGDPNDPEFRMRLEMDAARNAEMMKQQAAVETDEQRVDRLLAERRTLDRR